MLSRTFRAMGTEVELILEDDDGSVLLEEAEREFHRLEGVLTRFDPESELSRLNRERSMRVGPELLELAQLAVDARARSAGRFDPTVHDSLVAAGYDRTFEDLDRDTHSPAEPPARCGGRVDVDRAASTVSIEPGFRLDLGGIAKGWAADRVLAGLSSHAPALVNAGGDVAASGRPWHVGVDVPGETITLELDSGGLATSGRDRRTWRRGGVEAHHLIDPATGLPSRGDVSTVTVAASSAAEAEVLAKTLFLAGSGRRAAEVADEHGVPAVIVGRDGAVLLAGGLS